MSDPNIEPADPALEPRKFIGAEGTECEGEGPRTGDAHQREVDEELDAALACTFPASDPVGCLTSCRTREG